MKKLKDGLLITFEGGEAVGKTTQIALLANALIDRGYKVWITREPGGTELGEELREIIKTRPMHAKAELFLFEASRAQLCETEIKPRLKRGEIILSDRFAESSLVYQGVGRGLGRDFVAKANAMATGSVRPDFIVLLDGKVAEARLKARRHHDRIEREKASFHRKIAKSFRELSRKDKRVHLYRADWDRQKIHKMILKDLESRLLQ